MSEGGDSGAKGIVSEVTKAVLKEAEGTTHMKAAGEEAAQAILALAKFVNNAAGIIRVINAMTDGARNYLGSLFESDVSERTRDIPKENLVSPDPWVLLPAVNALAISHANPELKDMFLSLIASAMDSRCKTHPSFVEVIKQLSPDEAALLRNALRYEQIPIVELRMKTKGGGFAVLFKYLLPPSIFSVGGPEDGESDRRRAMIDNWVRLRLFDVEMDRYIKGNAYDWADQLVAGLRKTKDFPNRKNIEYQKGGLRLTKYGALFAQSIGINLGAQDPTEAPVPRRGPLPK